MALHAIDYGGIVLICSELLRLTIKLVWLYAQKNPSRWAYNLFLRDFGPRTDTRFMTQPEMLASARSFFVLCLHVLAFGYIGFVAVRKFYPGGFTHPLFFAAVGILSMLFLLLFVSGLWILILAGLRRIRTGL